MAEGPKGVQRSLRGAESVKFQEQKKQQEKQQAARDVGIWAI
jgi:hypothetical protein